MSQRDIYRNCRHNETAADSKDHFRRLFSHVWQVLHRATSRWRLALPVIVELSQHLVALVMPVEKEAAERRKRSLHGIRH